MKISKKTLLFGTSLMAFMPLGHAEDSNAIYEQMQNSAQFFNYTTNSQEKSPSDTESTEKKLARSAPEETPASQFTDLEEKYFDSVNTRASGVDKNTENKKKRAR